MKILKNSATYVLVPALVLIAFLYYRSVSSAEWADFLSMWYRSSVIKPLEFGVLFMIASSFFVLFFNPTIQKLWCKKAVWWLVTAVAIILILLPTYESGGGFTILGGTTEMIILWGWLFSIFTLIYTLYHRFYLRTGVQIGSVPQFLRVTLPIIIMSALSIFIALYFIF